MSVDGDILYLPKKHMSLSYFCFLINGGNIRACLSEKWPVILLSSVFIFSPVFLGIASAQTAFYLEKTSKGAQPGSLSYAHLN